MPTAIGAGGWVDVTVTLRSGMVHWPRDPAVRFKRRMDMDRGAPCNLSAMSMGTHTGTHVDAPLHFLRSGAGIDELALGAVMGPARVIGIDDPASIKVDELRRHRIRRGERIVFKTANSRRCWTSGRFVRDYVYIEADAAKMLAARKVKVVGIDYLSVGGYETGGMQAHVALLRAGTWLIEGLYLAGIKPGPHEMIALPLKIQGGDGAPARVLLRRRPG